VVLGTRRGQRVKEIELPKGRHELREGAGADKGLYKESYRKGEVLALFSGADSIPPRRGGRGE